MTIQRPSRHWQLGLSHRLRPGDLASRGPNRPDVLIPDSLEPWRTAGLSSWGGANFLHFLARSLSNSALYLFP